MELGLYNKRGTLVPYHTDDTNTLFLKGDLPRLALDYIYQGHSIVFLDSRGDAEDVLDRIPRFRQADTLYFNPSVFPFGFNLFSRVPTEKHARFATALLEALKGVWGYEDVATPTLDMYLRAGFQTLLLKRLNITDLKFFLTDKEYRKEVLCGIHDPMLLHFWEDYEEIKDKRREVSSTLNKLWALLLEPTVLYCLDQKHNRLTFSGKVVLLSFKTAGKDNAALLGALVLAQLYLEDPDVTLFVNGKFGNAILGSILNETRIHACVNLQYLDEVPRRFLPSLLGGVDRVVVRKTSVKDAEILEPEFEIHDDRGLYELREGTFRVSGFRHELTSFPLRYQKTEQRDKILRRNISQCSTPIHQIEARLRRFQ